MRTGCSPEEGCRGRRAALRIRLPLIAVSLALAGCGEGREVDDAAIAPKAEPYNVIAPVPDPVASGVPAPQYAPGEWRPEQVRGAQGLRFGAATGPSLFRMYCDGRGGAVFERLGVESTGDIEMMEVQAGDEVARLALNEVETEQAILRASVPFNHNLMTRLLRSEGELYVKAGESPALRLPLNDNTAALARRCEKPDGSGASTAAG